MLGGFRIPMRVSAGGGCRLYDCADGTIALNLSRPADHELLPALFGCASIDVTDDNSIAALLRACDPAGIVARGRCMGLAIASENEDLPLLPPCQHLTEGLAAVSKRRSPRILDLSALWAGPLATHLLQLAGADVVKVESKMRPDGMREGDPAFFALLNQNKRSVMLDLHRNEDREALLSLIARSDIVIEAARPRALAQLGIDANVEVRRTPGLTWITITGHGATDDAANWVGFGDDCGIAAGLGSAMRAATGRPGFVGDAIADPLTGIRAAELAWRHWSSGIGCRLALSMSAVVAEALETARSIDNAAFGQSLVVWSEAAGSPFSPVRMRDAGPIAALGAHNSICLAESVRC